MSADPARQPTNHLVDVAVGFSFTESSMRPDLDFLELTPGERRHEVAAIFAAGLLRLRDRHALGGHPAISPDPEILATASKETLAIPSEPSVTVHAG